MRFLFFVVAVALANPINGQNCTCESNFEWVKKTFEENDAGFQYIIDRKGQTAYSLHNQLILERVREAKTLTECAELLREWLRFFRSGHFEIQILTHEQNVSQTTNEIEKYGVWEVDIPQFAAYIETKQEADYEGIWDIGGVYKVGIKKEGANYIGFIIESNVEGWTEPGQIKLKIELDKSTFFMRDHSPAVSGTPELIGKNHLQIGNQMLIRLNSIFSDDPLAENYLKSRSSRVPFLDELNATTLYLRIPSFDLGSKSAIDQLLADNRDKILKTENLIIDLRNNGGGSDQSYAELIPFLYTNPIREISVAILSSPLNNQLFLELSTATHFFGQEINDDMRQFAKGISDKLQSSRLGEFVEISDEPISIIHRDTVYEFPRNVGIIINERNASATEQFLLAAKQSRKVKLFGTTTFGALDISNMNLVESPCNEFMLWYCMSRSLRIPDFAIDDIGLQPDFYLDRTIPQWRWVEFVNDILNQ